jgi:hypothetical protein
MPPTALPLYLRARATSLPAQARCKGWSLRRRCSSPNRVAQAALEIGWGQQEIRLADGRNFHNLYGIRAGSNWRGPVAEVLTTEYIHGSAQKVRGQFRANGSYEESFNDYASLISQSPWYAPAMRQLSDPQAYATALQKAGYATAPNYASLLGSMIEKTQRLQGTAPLPLAALTWPGATPPTTPPVAAMPTTAQMLSMRQGGQSASETAMGIMNSALNTVPGGQGANTVGPRQWRQSPYAELGMPTWPPTCSPTCPPIWQRPGPDRQPEAQFSAWLG